MARQDGVMEHVRVRDDDVAVNADRLTCVVRRIAVKRVGPHTEFARTVELQQFSDLVLREGFRRKEVEGLRAFATHGFDMAVSQRARTPGRLL